MELCSEKEYDPKHILHRLKEQNIGREVNLRAFGQVLWKLEEFDLTKKYFTRAIKELSSNDPLHVYLYESLSKLALPTVMYKRK